jgi:hypothetical protein
MAVVVAQRAVLAAFGQPPHFRFRVPVLSAENQPVDHATRAPGYACANALS